MLVEQRSGSGSVGYSPTILKLTAAHLSAIRSGGGQTWDCQAFGMGGEEERRSAFAMFDTDGSGTIDEDELLALARQLGASVSNADVSKVMREIDTDNSGEIDVQEFTAWWAKDAKMRVASGNSEGSGGGAMAGLRRKAKGAVETAQRTVLLKDGKLKLQVPGSGGRAPVTVAKWEYKQVVLTLIPGDGSGGEARFEIVGLGGKQSFLLSMNRQMGKQVLVVDERDALFYCWRVLSGAEPAP